jgi:hypothetical protein
MANYCFVVPILPGGADKMLAFIQNEIKNNPEHDRVVKSAGMTREQVWIQPTPMGDFAVVSYEVDDPAKTFRVLTDSTEPYAIKFRNLLKEAHGVDFSQPMPLNTLARNWAA